MKLKSPIPIPRTSPTGRSEANDTAPLYPSSLGRKSPAVVHTLSALMFLATIMAVSLADVPIAAHFGAHPLPASVVEMHNVAELFGHGMGVVLVIVVLLALDPARRWIIPRLAFAAWGGGLAANVIKVCVTRPRPHAVDMAGLSNSWASFGATMDGVSDGSILQSFPSAHVATAAGLAVVLSRLYPHARWLFVALVVTVASQRIGGNSHFVSDCFAGALLGWAAGQVTFQEWWASIWFDRLEYVLGRPQRHGAANSATAVTTLNKCQRAA